MYGAKAALAYIAAKRQAFTKRIPKIPSRPPPPVKGRYGSRPLDPPVTRIIGPDLKATLFSFALGNSHAGKNLFFRHAKHKLLGRFGVLRSLNGAGGDKQQEKGDARRFHAIFLHTGRGFVLDEFGLFKKSVMGRFSFL